MAGVKKKAPGASELEELMIISRLRPSHARTRLKRQ